MFFRYFVCLFFLPLTLFGSMSKQLWAQRHLRYVNEKFQLRLLAEGRGGDSEVVDFELVSFFPADIESARFLLICCVENLKKQLVEQEEMQVRYGISFLDLEGNLRKEGVARVALLTPKKSRSEKVFYSLFDEKGRPSQLVTERVEDYEEAQKLVPDRLLPLFDKRKRL
jgi:hypothetical protein